MSETQPNKLSDTQPRQVKKAGRGFFWLSLLILLAAVVLGSLGGYGLGIQARVNAQSTQVETQLDEQFILAKQDFDAKRYDIARQRLEYIIQKNPNYPEASTLLASVLVQQAITPTPEPTATATITPTPDIRNQETIFAQAQQQLQSKDWSGTLASLDALRKADPTYHAVQVDDMYYIALRNRGMDQILGVGAYPQTNFEGGIYDLTLAERFGPLDGQAESYRTGARMFLLASSFYGIDWGQAVNYFGQVYQYYPGLRDSSNETAAQRYREALLAYGDLQAGNVKLKDRCRALDSWDAANSISQLNDEYSSKFFKLNLECNPPTATIDPASLYTATPDPASLYTATPDPAQITPTP